MLKRTLHIANIVTFGILLFSCTLCMFLGIGVLDDEEFKKSENRARHFIPKAPTTYSELSEFPERFENWFNDSYGLRPQLRKLYSTTMYSLGVSSMPAHVIIGHEDWLFIKQYPLNGGIDVLGQHQGIDLFSEDELKAWVDSAQVKHNFLEQKGIPFIVAFPPKKHTIYNDMLPWYFQSKGKTTRIDQLLTALDDAGIFTVDLRPSLLDAKSQGPLYFKGDTHWNPLAGFIAYQSILRGINLNYGETEPVIREAVTFSPNKAHTNDLSRMIDAQEYLDDMGYAVEFHNPNRVTVMDREGAVFPSANFINAHKFVRVAVNEDNLNAPSVLILRDSFTNFLHPYFNQTFSKTIYAPHGIYTTTAPGSAENLPELTEEFAPDIVILLVMDSFLSLPLP